MDLKTARFFMEYTQWDLATDTGINQAKISHAERGKLVLNAVEKKKIVSVLGCGFIDWERTENQSDHGLSDFAMPKVDPNPPDIKFQTSDDGWLRYRRPKGSMGRHETIPVGEPDDPETYEYNYS